MMNVPNLMCVIVQSWSIWVCVKVKEDTDDMREQCKRCMRAGWRHSWLDSPDTEGDVASCSSDFPHKNVPSQTDQPRIPALLPLAAPLSTLPICFYDKADSAASALKDILCSLLWLGRHFGTEVQVWQKNQIQHLLLLQTQLNCSSHISSTC